MGSFTKLKDILENKGKFLLICHIEPDGDAIGSMLALGKSLVNRGQSVRMICLDQLPEIFSFLPDIGLIENVLPEDNFDAIVLLDNGDFRRTGCVDFLKEQKVLKVPIVNIDHHTKNDLWRFVTVNFVDEAASSTSEILHGLFASLNFLITPEMATALMCGIFYDTGGFKHSNTNEKVLDIASDLMKKGAKLRKVSENISGSKSIASFRLWGIALNRLAHNKSLGISVSYLDHQDLIAAGASEDDVSGLVNLLNSAPESKAALLLYEDENGKIKGSLRTDRDDVDVSAIAKEMGGGGHRKAAGFTVNGKIVADNGSWKVV